MVWTKRISFTLWPVGQGLFTLADVWVGSKFCRIVYDCGTFCPSQQVTAPAFMAMRNRMVDLLVVSHFHWDHISRIPQLLKTVPEVKEVWIPYLSPQQRLLFAFSTAVGGMLSGSDESDVIEATLLVSGGPRWFESHGCSVQEVGEPPSLTDPEGGDWISPDEPRGDGYRPDRPPEAGEENRNPPQQLRLSHLRRVLNAFSTGSSFRAFHSVLEAVGSARAGVVETPVELLTWILPIADAKTQDLLSSMSAWLQRIGEKITAEDLLEQSTGQVNTQALVSLVSALSRKAHRSRLRRIYLELNHDLNAGSLFLLVHPTQQSAWYRVRYALRFWSEFYGKVVTNDTLEPGVLWTGDAPSEVLESLLADGTHLLQKRLQGVLLHQVAHHGSASSFSKTWIAHIGSGWNGELSPTSVISSGRSNDFGHPSPRVLWEYGGRVVLEGSEVFEGSFEWL